MRRVQLALNLSAAAWVQLCVAWVEVDADGVPSEEVGHGQGGPGAGER